MINEIEKDNALIVYLNKVRKAIVLEEIAREIESSSNPNNPKIQELAKVKAELEKIGAALCLPLFTEEKLIGIFNLGNKLSQDMYTDEDIDLLTTLSNQLAVSIENAMLHEDILEAQKRLYQADKLAALGTIAAGVAHEIKNPLSAIKGMTQLVDRSIESGDKQFVGEFKEVVPAQLDRINNLLENLLKFGRPPKPQITRVNLNTIVEDTLKLFANKLTASKIEVLKELGNLPEVNADPEQITQVITNLVLNASQAMEGGGQLTAKTYLLAGREAVVEVSDTGEGIAEDKLRRIFEPFFTTKKEGTGMGLAISYRIIKEHNGEIEVKSVLGKGTTFIVRLPV